MRFKLNKASVVLGLVLWVGSLDAATVQVTISQDRQFVPDRVKVFAGDTVEYVNESTMNHTVTADPSLAKDPNHVILPEGAEPFHSGIVRPGETFSQVFGVAGLYQYICLPHEMHGMQGIVEVVATEE